MGQIYTSSDRLINLCVLQDTYNELFCVFGDFYESGTQGTARPEVTKSLLAEDCYLPFKPQYPNANSPNLSLYLSLKNELREFDKR